MFKLGFYVPESHLEEVKSAAFAAGAGRIGNYDCCCWQSLGEGQFRPCDDSRPFIGQVGKLEQVAEYRVEMVCGNDCVGDVVAAMKQAHPYEEPAWDLVQLVTEVPG